MPHLVISGIMVLNVTDFSILLPICHRDHLRWSCYFLIINLLLSQDCVLLYTHH